MDPEEKSVERSHSPKQIQEHYLKNLAPDGSDWEQALLAVYDLGVHAGWELRGQQGAVVEG